MCTYSGFDLLKVGHRVLLTPHHCDNEPCQGGLPFQQAILAAAMRTEMYASDLRKCETFEEYVDWDEKQHARPPENITHFYKPIKPMNGEYNGTEHTGTNG